MCLLVGGCVGVGCVCLGFVTLVGSLWVVIDRWVVVRFEVVSSCDVGALRLLSCVCALVSGCWVL